MAMIAHAYILRRLIKPGELMKDQDPHILRKCAIRVLLYLAGIAVAWFNVYAAFLVYLLTPLFFLAPFKARKS
jgi:hypothetical protein